jgi:hypothetical protein
MIHELAPTPVTQQQRKGHVMPLDLIPIEDQAASNSVARGDNIFVTHKRIDDVSLYEKYGQIRRVPIEAVCTVPDLMPSGEIVYDAMEPRPMEGFHALQNKATGGLLNVRPVGKTYALIPHDTLFKAQADLLAASDLPLDNVEVVDRIYEEGARVHRTIYFHDLQARSKTLAGDDDVVRCRMDMFNSVDMSWALQIFSGAYRDLCRNTLVFGGEKAYHQRKVHRGHVSAEAMIGKATMGLSMWSGQKEQMMRWRNASLTNRQFSDILKESICRKNTEAAKTDERLSVNERRLNYMLERFNEEKRELGSTLWAGYNALTHWATHLPDTRATGRNERKMYTRNEQVRAIVGGPSWQYLEGLAS